MSALDAAEYTAVGPAVYTAELSALDAAQFAAVGPAVYTAELSTIGTAKYATVCATELSAIDTTEYSAIVGKEKLNGDSTKSDSSEKAAPQRCPASLATMLVEKEDPLCAGNVGKRATSPSIAQRD